MSQRRIATHFWLMCNICSPFVHRWIVETEDDETNDLISSCPESRSQGQFGLGLADAESNKCEFPQLFAPPPSSYSEYQRYFES